MTTEVTSSMAFKPPPSVVITPHRPQQTTVVTEDDDNNGDADVSASEPDQSSSASSSLQGPLEQAAVHASTVPSHGISFVNNYSDKNKSSGQNDRISSSSSSSTGHPESDFKGQRGLPHPTVNGILNEKEGLKYKAHKNLCHTTTSSSSHQPRRHTENLITEVIEKDNRITGAERPSLLSNCMRPDSAKNKIEEDEMEVPEKQRVYQGGMKEQPVVYAAVNGLIQNGNNEQKKMTKTEPNDSASSNLQKKCRFKDLDERSDDDRLSDDSDSGCTCPSATLTKLLLAENPFVQNEEEKGRRRLKNGLISKETISNFQGLPSSRTTPPSYLDLALKESDDKNAKTKKTLVLLGGKTSKQETSKNVEEKTSRKIPDELFTASIFVNYKREPAVFYETGLDEMIFGNTEDKSLLCYRNDPEDWESKAEIKAEKRRKLEMAKRKAMTQAAKNWRKKCRNRRLKRELERRRSNLTRCQSSTAVIGRLNANNGLNVDPLLTSKLQGMEGSNLQEDQNQIYSSTPRPLLRANSETALFQAKRNSGNFRARFTPDDNIEERILKRKEMAYLFQWYYPEGGFGWIIVAISSLCQGIVLGFQLSLPHPLMYKFLGDHIKSQNLRFQFWPSLVTATAGGGGGRNSSMILSGFQQTANNSVTEVEIAILFGLSVGISLLVSPFVTLFCQRRSLRLTAVIGGLVCSLGILFASFANTMTHLYISIGFFFAIGSAMIRDSATVALSHYFRKLHDVANLVPTISLGLGFVVVSSFVDLVLQRFSWRTGLQIIAVLMTIPFLAGACYRSATLYHPQRRAILHLKSQKRKIALKHFRHGIGGKEFNTSASACPTGTGKLGVVRRRSVQAVFSVNTLIGFGIYVPFLYLIKYANALKRSQIQLSLGLGWVVGACSSAFAVHKSSSSQTSNNISRDCVVGRVYALQISAFLVSSVLLLIYSGLSSTNSPSSLDFTALAWLFGGAAGAYFHSLRVHVFDKVKSRDYPAVMAMLHSVQSISVLIGIPTMAFLDKIEGIFTDFKSVLFVSILGFCGFAVLAVSTSRSSKVSVNPEMKNKRIQTSMNELDLEKSEKFSSDGKRAPKIVVEVNSDLDEDSEDAALMPNADEDDEDFEDENGIIIDDDRITSCAKVENRLVFSEFAQNLSKLELERRLSVTSASSTSNPKHYRSNSTVLMSSSLNDTSGSGGSGGFLPPHQIPTKFRRLLTLKRHSTESFSLSDRSSIGIDTDSDNRQGNSGLKSILATSKDLKSSAITIAAAVGGGTTYFLEPRPISVIEEVPSTTT